MIFVWFCVLGIFSSFLCSLHPVLVTSCSTLKVSSFEFCLTSLPLPVCSCVSSASGSIYCLIFVFLFAASSCFQPCRPCAAALLHLGLSRDCATNKIFSLVAFPPGLLHLGSSAWYVTIATFGSSVREWGVRMWCLWQLLTHCSLTFQVFLLLLSRLKGNFIIHLFPTKRFHILSVGNVAWNKHLKNRLPSKLRAGCLICREKWWISAFDIYQTFASVCAGFFTQSQHHHSFSHILVHFTTFNLFLIIQCDHLILLKKNSLVQL